MTSKFKDEYKATYDWVSGLMENYTADKVVVDAEKFADTLARLMVYDLEQSLFVEGYNSLENQREHSINFTWGHNHDFESFRIDGILGDRHIELITDFIYLFDLPKDLSGKTVLDVGAWTGGTTLLLAAMDAFEIFALEEVVKYNKIIDFLAKSFLLPITCNSKSGSIYDNPFNEYFDYVIFPGVLYHLSDPIVALRILFNSLKDGGELYLETMYEQGTREEAESGPRFYFKAGKGSNWFVPNVWAIRSLLHCVGFDEVSAIETFGDRAYVKATRKEWKEMLRAGLSDKSIW